MTVIPPPPTDPNEDPGFSNDVSVVEKTLPRFPKKKSAIIAIVVFAVTGVAFFLFQSYSNGSSGSESSVVLANFDDEKGDGKGDGKGKISSESSYSESPVSK